MKCPGSFVLPSSLAIFLTRPFCFSFILFCSMESFWTPTIYALLTITGNRGSITIGLYRANVQFGGSLRECPKESIHFLNGKQRVPFLRSFYPPFCGGGFSLFGVGEFRASEYSLGGLEWRVDSWLGRSISG